MIIIKVLAREELLRVDGCQKSADDDDCPLCLSRDDFKFAVGNHRSELSVLGITVVVH